VNNFKPPHRNDPKDIALQRYLESLERSVLELTQQAVFEPNGEQLWAQVRTTTSNFLVNEWQSGRLLGSKPEEAFFVRCDRTTMTQNDIDNGRLVMVVGVAPVKPAEFVVLRISRAAENDEPPKP
jgi:phage tail sheath protein FI